MLPSAFAVAVAALSRLFRREPCAACAAKDQTIALLADVVDWHRAQHGLTAQSATQVVERGGVWSVPEQRAEGADRSEPLHASEDEEDILAELEAGSLSQEEAERALARIQAMNQIVEVVR